MISRKDFVAKVENIVAQDGIKPISDELLDQIGGGSPNYYDSFHDNYRDGPIIGPTFIENFHEHIKVPSAMSAI